jgi:diacylglycerol kinase (ATP)
MRKVVLLNPTAGAAASAKTLREFLRSRADFVLLESVDAAESTSLARTAVRAGCDRLLIAGGDGTIHHVVNALSADLDQICLGVLPLGTGNDLCRTLAIPEDPLTAFAVLEEGVERQLDLIEARTHQSVSLIVNVASGGFSGQLHEILTPEMKAIWGPLAYLRGAAGALTTLHSYATTLGIDEDPRETEAVINVIVANCRYAAHGFRVASPANPEDGRLDVVVVRNATMFDLTDVAARLLTGDYLDSVSVYHRQAQRVEVAALPGMWFSFDGELTTNEAITFSVRPKALRILVGPGYHADPGMG